MNLGCGFTFDSSRFPAHEAPYVIFPQECRWFLLPSRIFPNQIVVQSSVLLADYQILKPSQGIYNDIKEHLLIANHFSIEH